MQTTFYGKRISSVLGILPQTEAFFDDEVDNYSFPARQTMRLKKVMGFNKHRLAKETSTVSDFAVYGMNYILEHGWIKREEIGAVVTVTLCPDFFVPHIGTIVQGKCGLSRDVICLDIAQGCCGFLVGLMEAFMLLEHMEDKKVVLINGDVLSHKVSRRDRNDFPLIGDAATITIVENCLSEKEIYYELHMDGEKRDALKIPAGAFRMPSSSETSEMTDQGDGNFRSLDHIHMDGSAVFNFVQTEVPPLLEHLLEQTKETRDTIDYFLFHQPNKFMLQKLADKAEIPKEKLPMNLVETYGNSSGASIPMTAVLNLKDKLLHETCRCCFSAFGSGLAWGGMILDFGNLAHCEMIESEL